MTPAHAVQEAASRTAGSVDAVFVFIAVVSLFFFLLVEGLLIGFALRYRRRKGEEAVATSAVTGHTLLEVVWIAIPSAVVVAFFVYGYVVYRDLGAHVPGATDVQVTARQFLFEFRYPDGRTTVNELRIPRGKPVKLLLTSADVIHSFYVPAYRIKQDMIPGRYTTLYLHPDREGTYDVYCAEYCGVGHSTMRAAVVVMPEADYAAWAAGAAAATALPPAERGRELLTRAGCLNCHALEGTEKIGPNLKGLFGRERPLADGRTVRADEEYLRESLVDPNAKVVKGYPAVMPTFKGTLTEEDVAALVVHLRSLR